MTNILDMPAAEVEIPFSILDTDLYKVSQPLAIPLQWPRADYGS
jgi:hypothetical protein